MVEVLEGVDPAAAQEALVEAAIAKLVMPALEVGGDSRLEMPPKSRIKVEATEHDGQVRAGGGSGGKPTPRAQLRHACTGALPNPRCCTPRF